MGARVVHPGRPIESAVLRCQKPALLGLLRLSAWHLLATVECLAKIPERSVTNRNSGMIGRCKRESL